VAVKDFEAKAAGEIELYGAAQVKAIVDAAIVAIKVRAAGKGVSGRRDQFQMSCAKECSTTKTAIGRIIAIFLIRKKFMI